jgi:hypothetical protein
MDTQKLDRLRQSWISSMHALIEAQTACLSAVNPHVFQDFIKLVRAEDEARYKMQTARLDYEEALYRHINAEE